MFERYALFAQRGHGDVLIEDGFGGFFRQYVEKLFLFHE
jgi:hypothetical protein